MLSSTRPFLLLTLAAFLPASQIRAQEPIVRLDVKPAKPAFGDWQKPLVIRTAEDAGKHFDKDALEALTKKVDLKKQFVVIFAWRGSGGDKLDYIVAESFPEQIMFSLKAGLTDDLRSHVHVFALRNNVKWSIRGADGKAKEGGDKPVVRPLQRSNLEDPTETGNFGRKPSATTLSDAVAVEKFLGKFVADGLIDRVDLKKEAIVVVSWNTSAPDGKLMHEIKGEGKDCRITFYVQGPPGGGRRLLIGTDVFAVPRDIEVTIDPKER